MRRDCRVSWPRDIVITGAPAAGKSTLATVLASALACSVVRERLDHPLVKAYYQNPRRWAFHLSVLFMVRSIEALQQRRSGSNANEWALWDYDARSHFQVYCRQLLKDRNLTRSEYALCRELNNQLVNNKVEPRLVIFLRSSPTELLARVRRRSRATEGELMSKKHLTNLVTRFERWRRAYKGALLVVDTNSLDFARSSRDREVVVSLISDALERLPD